MTLEEALRAHLIAHSGLSALVGSRVYPVQVPQNVTLPAMSYQRISTAPTQHRNQPVHGRVRMQLDGWASNYAAAVELRTQMRAAMETFQRGSAPRVDAALLQDDRDLREPDSDRWRVSMDYFLFGTQE